MNECFFIGTLEQEVHFQFLLKEKRSAIAHISIRLLDKSTTVNLIAYDELADLCYQTLKTQDIIFTRGKLTTQGEVEIKQIQHLKSWTSNQSNHKKGNKEQQLT